MQFNPKLLSICRRENIRIKEEGLAKLTWGNYSCLDRDHGLMYIKPSGTNPAEIKDEDISVLDLEGNILSGMNPSVDSEIHLSIYRENKKISSICHSHSTYATAYAQSGKDIPQRGTTHCDTFSNTIRTIFPPLSIYELGRKHEMALGEFISRECLNEESGAVLVSFHGPFVWSIDYRAVDLAVALEEIAKMSFITESLEPGLEIPSEISKFHWSRKNGSSKWYGQ